MNKILKHIKRIERKAYPRFMRQMQDCRSIEDVAEYAECSERDLLILTGEHWYAIFALHGETAEGVDLAKLPGSPKIDWGKLVRKLRERNVRIVELDAREKTSYKLIKRYSSALGMTILSDSAWDWDGETMHSITLGL